MFLISARHNAYLDIAVRNADFDPATFRKPLTLKRGAHAIEQAPWYLLDPEVICDNAQAPGQFGW